MQRQPARRLHQAVTTQDLSPRRGDLEPIEIASGDELRALQIERLRKSVRHAYDNVPHYRSAFGAAGVHPDDVKTLDDLAKLPVTTKADLRDNYPFGMFGVPRDQVARVHASSGTTGKPTVVGYTTDDLDMWANVVALCRIVDQRPARSQANLGGHAMSTETLPVLVERNDATATVIINRPDRRNALDTATKIALRDALESVAADGTVRAVVLTGAGSCVGQDLGEHADAMQADATTAFDTVDEHYSPIVAALATMPKPVIAAVNGACVGAGLGLALACDLRIVSSAAKFGTAFSAIGLTCDSGLSATLVRAVGQSRASELVLLGDAFDAHQALAWGIGGTIVDPEDLLTRAQDLAQRLAAGPTRAYAESKSLLAAAASSTLGDALTAESAAQHRLGLTSDHQGALTAFMAKEKPTFDGR
jgi:2-(1,2-epoxy-1,2-dihydrophenyl)acetyl-CoA isomerase